MPKLLRTGAYAHTGRGPYTQKLLDTETFAALCLSQGSFYTQKLLHTETCPQKPLHREAFTQTEAFTRRNFFIDKCLREGTLRTNGFCTQQLSHREAFARTSFYTGFFSQSSVYAEQLLQTEALTQRGLYTEELYTQMLLHRRAVTQSNFTQSSFCTQTPLHKEAFLHKSFLHIEAFTHRGFHTEALHREAFTQRSV